MDLRDMINIIEKEKFNREEVLKERKNNINSNYLLAKQDFRVITNIEDTIHILTNVIDDLEELQKRIFTRNRQSLFD